MAKTYLVTRSKKGSVVAKVVKSFSLKGRGQYVKATSPRQAMELVRDV